jgi:hypothetical protein
VNTTTANITAKAITGSFTSANKVYDGNTSAAATNRQLSGAVSGDAVSLTGGTASFADKTVATGKTVTLTGATLSGADAGNYSLTNVGTTTADITAKAIAGSFTSANKVYDGNTSAAATNRQLSGVVSGDAVSLTGGTASFADKNVATGKTVTLSGASLTGADAGNYTVTVNTTTADITTAPLTITANSFSKTYGDTYTFTGHEFTTSPSPLYGGDTISSVSLSSAGAGALATASATPYPITVTGAVFSSGLASNYAITYVPGSLTVTARDANAAYIGQTTFVASGSSSTTAQVTLTASVADPAGDDGLISAATVTFTDLLTGKVLASNVRVSPVSNTNSHTGTANTVVTLSTGQYGAQTYLIEVTVNGSYKNTQQTTAAPGSDPYNATHATVTVMIPPTAYSTQGGGQLSKSTGSPAGVYANADASYSLAMKYNSKGTNPQGQVQLVLARGDGTYYVKSNSISSLAFAAVPAGQLSKDETIYTKASIYKIGPNGALTSIDGGVTLRVDAHEGCTTNPNCTGSSGDTIGFTVLSSKDSSLYYSNNWVYDGNKLSWSTVQQSVTGATSVVIN